MASLPPETGALAPNAIRQASADLGVSLSDGQSDRLTAFAALLVKWNRVHNLTAVESPADILTHHLLDSLSIVPELARIGPGHGQRILDVGAGGGLPGVAVAVALPDSHVTLIDSVQKKTAFLQQVFLELALSNVAVVHGRVEEFRAPPFDVIVSRAFAALAAMVRMTSHLIAPTGYWAAMKGVYPAEEINALPSTVELARAVKLRVPLLGAERHLVILRPR
jgi:16S rRNA (guanine527-N7)-methyltransferase